MRGVERHVTVVRRERCRTCGGAGVLRALESRCIHCEGVGTIRSARGHMVFAKRAWHCAGTGRLQQVSCGTCARPGRGERGARLSRSRIPAGRGRR